MMPFGIALLKHALLTERVEIRQFRNRFARLLVQIAHPSFLRATFCELLLDAQTFRQLSSHVVDGFTFKPRFDDLVGENDVGHVAAGGIKGKIHLLRSSAVRQQNIGIFSR
ncbi:hypothetical protein D3C78_1429000 [compost metagenome]